MTTDTKSIAVTPSGSGHQDGSEIHEATLTLWAIHKNNSECQCYAPNIPQHHVLSHLTGEEMDKEQNVLVESARIARENVLDLVEFGPTRHDALATIACYMPETRVDQIGKGADRLNREILVL